MEKRALEVALDYLARGWASSQSHIRANARFAKIGPALGSPPPLRRNGSMVKRKTSA